MTLAEIKTLVRNSPVFEDTATLWSSDQYWLPSRAWFESDYMPVVQSTFRQYTPANNRRDCTQAVRIALALAGEAMGQRQEDAGIAIGRTTGLLMGEINGIKAEAANHDTCIAVLNDGFLYFYEPQTSKLTLASNVTLGDWAAGLVEL